jgi:hypothetical protein
MKTPDAAVPTKYRVFISHGYSRLPHSDICNLGQFELTDTSLTQSQIERIMQEDRTSDQPPSVER